MCRTGGAGISVLVVYFCLRQVAGTQISTAGSSLPSVDSANPKAIAVLPFQNAAVRELQ
jgi:hypothetical protein